MPHITSDEHAPSSQIFSVLESWARSQIQGLLQRVLEEEVEEFLGRKKHVRRSAVDAPPGRRNGYGKPRKLSMQGGTVTLRRPRARDTEQKFVSQVLPLFARRTRQMGELLPELYLHGLAKGDFELALRGLLGDAAPLSRSSIDRLRERWEVTSQQVV